MAVSFRTVVVGFLCSLAAACTSVPSLTPQAPPGDEAGVSPAARPLQVPPLTQLADGPARALQGRFTRSDWSGLPGWNADDLAGVWGALVNDCKGLMRPISGQLNLPARANPRAWHGLCSEVQARDEAATPAGADLRRFLEQHLQAWRVNDAAGKPARNTVTGYYEPTVRASRRRHGVYQWPLYRTPDDLLTIDLGALYPELAGKRVRGKLEGRRVVPYDTRAQIGRDAARRPQAIVWVDDPVEAFFLQIQGSGRAQLDDGSVIRLAYDNHNGHPYSSIARWLADQGQMPLARASMPNIKDWARRNPARVPEMLNANAAMVFFREETIHDPALGPAGAYGIPLAAGRAIAVDAHFVPLGAPVWLSTTHPASSTPLQRLVFAQDTGAAIKGAARADYYWGSGDAAGKAAGRMKQAGAMWVLWPRSAGEPSAR
ncbi:MAG: murein transglycosylase A [Castellaniella sp.]